MAKRKMKRRKKTAARKVTKRAVGAKRGPRSTAGVAQAVSGLQAYRKELLAQRVEFDAKLSAVDKALSAMGTSTRQSAAKSVRRVGRPPAVRTGRGRGLRPGSLKSYIAKVMSGGAVMPVRNIATGVLKSGYKTKNKTLAKSVGIALTEMPGVKKVARGSFRMK